ncbi:MAG: VOC family protein [Pseudomonadota bacterium]
MKSLIRAISIAVSLSLISQADVAAQPPKPNPLDQIRAEHIMISTDSFDDTLTWYRDMLGFELIHKWSVPELPGIELGYMKRNGFVIEVVQTPKARTQRAKPKDLGQALGDRGIGHLAFRVADVDAVAAELKARGADFLVEPTSFPDSGRRLIFIFDNNGNLLEFLTPLSAYEARP